MEENISAQSNNQKREMFREIPKSSVNEEYYHLINLLGEHSQYFLDADVIELKDNFQIQYTVAEHIIRFEEIKHFTKDVKLRYLINIAELEKLQNTRFTFNLRSDELYFTKNGLPLLKTRGLKNIVDPLPTKGSEFLDCYKALVLCAFNENTSFDSLIEGNLKLHKGSSFENKVIESSDLAALKKLLNEYYKQQSRIYEQNFKYISKHRFALYKWTSLIISLCVVLLSAVLIFIYFSIVKPHGTIERGYQDFIKSDYTAVLNTYKNVNARDLDKEALYIYARSYIETNKQGLEKEKKENLLNNLTTNSNRDYLLYWVELGQGHLDEALNIATYLEDNDIIKLVLINKLNEIKNDPNLKSNERSEKTKKYNDQLQEILDKEKAVKDAEDKKKEKVEKVKDEKIKQQEENEKKQKEQAQKDKEKRQEAERK